MWCDGAREAHWGVSQWSDSEQNSNEVNSKNEKKKWPYLVLIKTSAEILKKKCLPEEKWKSTSRDIAIKFVLYTIRDDTILLACSKSEKNKYLRWVGGTVRGRQRRLERRKMMFEINFKLAMTSLFCANPKPLLCVPIGSWNKELSGHKINIYKRGST